MASPGGRAAPQLLPPVALTIAALTSLNLAVAYLIARAAGLRGIAFPDLVIWLLLAIGLAAAVGAVVGWRRYIADARAAKAATGPGIRDSAVE